jgi:nucleotide-binding universal stress UspA family protein
MIEIKRILVPLDGSPLAERALPLAKTLAQKFECQIILLEVLHFLIPTMSVPYQHFPDWVVENRKHARQEAESYLQARQDEGRQQGFEVDVLLRETSPAEDIVDVATTEQIDLIVMSTHGLGGLARWAIGSVADKVARHSPCPVLLVRQESVDHRA